MKKINIATICLLSLLSCQEVSQKSDSDKSNVSNLRVEVDENKEESISIDSIATRNENDKCDKNFDEFFKKFRIDSTFQSERVKFPLKNVYPSDDLELDDEFVTEYIDQEKYRPIDFSDDDEAYKKELYAYRVEYERLGDSVLYRLKGIDNGIHMTYEFHFIEECWYLVSIENAST